MYILLGILCVLCAVLGASLILLRREIHSLYLQLKEIQGGSHIELTMDTRNRRVAALCGLLNQIFASRDEERIQYEKAGKRIKQNVTGLAHDIRTPLTGAFGYLQLAKECTDLTRREKYLERAEWRLEELEDMLEELFLYTKLTSEGFTLSRSKLQVLPLLEECLFGFYSRFEEQNLSPEVVFETEGFWVWGDEEALKRIFLNLIQNALLHGEGGLCITQSQSRLIFENRVSGESQIDLQQIFDRFYKGSQARRKGSSGLGLFIVKELMERMEGCVYAEAENGSFSVILDFAQSFP